MHLIKADQMVLGCLTLNRCFKSLFKGRRSLVELVGLAVKRPHFCLSCRLRVVTDFHFFESSVHEEIN